MEGLPIRVNLKLTENDFVKQQYLIQIATFTRILLMIFNLVLFIYFYINNKNTGNYFWLFVLTGVSLAMYIISFVYYIPKNAKEDYRASYYCDREVPLVITENGIELERKENNISSVKWNQLYSVWSFLGYTMFYISLNNIITLPLRLLTKEQAELLNQTIKTRVDGKIRTNPYKLKLKSTVLNLFIFGFIAFIIYITYLSFTMKK